MALRKLSYREWQARVACLPPRPPIDGERLRFGLNTDKPLTPDHPHSRYTRVTLGRRVRFAQLMEQYDAMMEETA